MAKETFFNRIKNGWNAFLYEDKKREPSTSVRYIDLGYSSTIRNDRKRLSLGNDKSIVASMYNQIAVDVAAVTMRHVKVDVNNVYKETVNSGLNECLTLSANIDQTGREFMLDVVYSMFDEGCVAIVPVDVDSEPDVELEGSYTKILSIRTGRVTQWYPRDIRVEVYNDRTGMRQEITRPKETVAIVENPFYATMNQPNATLKRLVHKLNLLDAIDNQSGSSKLDLIVQLPYVVRGDAKKQQAADRKRELESQLENSKYGIAYIDATEKVTQLNRSADNNLMSQVEYLTSMLYSQLGITQSVFDGTADEKTMLNYYNRTIEPILSAISDEMTRKFLSKTARTQGHTIKFIRDPFRLVPVSEMAEIADKFTRNEILSSNELRSIVGYRPVEDERANELRNRNLNASEEQIVNPVLVDNNELSNKE